MTHLKRRKTPTVAVGHILMGSEYPIVIQSMTNTPTANIKATVNQICELADAGSELVRITINDAKAACAVPETIRILRDKGYNTPLIGDFHFNGHKLLANYPQMAQALSKYRINPGNIGKNKNHDENLDTILRIAKENNKPIRIGINSGSLDQELFTELMDKNSKLRKPKATKEIVYKAMVCSALRNAEYVKKHGLKGDKIILSVKMSNLQDMVTVYTQLAKKCNFVLHLGLTEAGSDIQGITSSSAALAILLQQGIGDTIRVSLTPQPGVPRSREVEVCKSLLQSLNLRYFEPTVTSCPSCGRTGSDQYQYLADDIKKFIKKRLPVWQKKYPGIEQLTIAIMGCVVNGPGESKHADIGISLPGISEPNRAPVYADGKFLRTLVGNNIKKGFSALLEEYVQKKFTKIS